MNYRLQKHCDCQLISAINARIYLGLGDINNALYEHLVDLTCGRIGSCINVRKVYPLLGLKCIDGPTNLKWIKEHLPVAINTLEEKCGFHSSLIIGVNSNKLILVNHWKKVFYWDELLSIMSPWEYHRLCRSFVAAVA